MNAAEMEKLMERYSRTRRDDQIIVAPSAITEDDIQAGAVDCLKKILLPEGQQ